MPAAAAKPTPEPLKSIDSKIDRAFQNFKETVKEDDARQFFNTKLSDVRDAVKTIERRLAKKQESRALGRVWPLLRGLEHYSGPLGVICGYKELVWIWAPIKLCLQVASEHLSAYDKLIQAYADIAAALPRFDRLDKALERHQDFQHVLADFYSDMLEFHRRAYIFIRQRTWKQVFNSSWGRFEKRFDNIIERLKKSQELIDREAGAYHIADFQKMRDVLLEQVRTEEERRSKDEFDKVINWLDIKDCIQEDHVDRLNSNCYEGTADWFLQHDKVSIWTKPGRRPPLLWINGIPGCGKSVLCSKLIRYMQRQNQSAIAFFICDFRSPGRNTCSNVLRQIASQLIKQNRDLVGLVYDKYYLPRSEPTESNMKELLSALLRGNSSIRLLLDGLDECKVAEQAEISKAIHGLVTEANKQDQTDCKAAIFSRNTGKLEDIFKKDCKISLKDEASAVHSSISTFVHHEIQQFRVDNSDVEISDEVLTRIEENLVNKAAGMFLWVHLVVDTLKSFESANDLELAVERLPPGIEEAYARILEDLRRNSPERLERATALLTWIAFAGRPLKTYEVLDGIVFCKDPCHLDQGTKLMPQVLDRCKPLIEISATGEVSFVHFTVQEYILDELSGPFLQRTQALNDVATGCISYIALSLNLVDDEIKQDDRIKSVALGLHGLHRYATTKWLHHMEELSKHLSQSSQLPGERLIKYIKALCKRHDHILRLQRSNENIPDIRVTNEKGSRSEEQLIAFHDVPEFCHLAGLIKEHERQFGNLVPEHSQTSDPTLFTEVSNAYNSMVQELLKPEDEIHVTGVSAKDILKFKSMYGLGAYQCRAIACPRHSVGFASDQERNEHELNAHPQVYHCSETSCRFFENRWLPSYSALENHIKDEHQSQDAAGDVSPNRKTLPKRRHLEEPCGLDGNDTIVDELVRTVLKKRRGGESTSVKMVAQGDVHQNKGNSTEQLRSAEHDGQQGPSSLPGEVHDAKQTATLVDANDSESTKDTTISSATYEGELAVLSIAARILSKGPQKIEPLSSEIGIPSNELAVFLGQIAEERDGVYHLNNGAIRELEKMDTEYEESQRTRETDSEPTGHTSL